MKIPEKVKIGGDVFTVNITDHIKGGEVYNGEVRHDDLEINIRPLIGSRRDGTFIHEVVHSILEHIGDHDQDERFVDTFAHLLHAVIVDNPDMFEGKSK